MFVVGCLKRQLFCYEKIEYTKDIPTIKTMYLIIDFSQKTPVYNRIAVRDSDEDKKYWQWHDKKKMQLEKKYKTTAETQFDDDEPVIVVGNKIYDSQGRLKQKEQPVQQKRKGWFW